jgi:diguanylate cyclase (GGDEF)-like protein
MNNKTMSIKSYAISFILLYIFVFLISSVVAFLDIKALQDDISQNNAHNGKSELIETLEKLVTRYKEETVKFSHWDEVRQQLNNPEFYHYWQTHRLFNSNALPDYVSEVSIYDEHGDALSSRKSGTLPSKINCENVTPYFTIINYKPMLITFSPIYKDNDDENALGYVAFKSDVLSQLTKITQFNHLQSHSIKALVSKKHIIESQDFIDYLSYKVQLNDESVLIFQQVNHVFFRNTIILVLFALFFYFLMSRFLSRPLRQVSTYIDTLKNQPTLKSCDDICGELDIQFHITELEKVKHSLSKYQRKLQTVYTNLDEKNQELWEMAHHDALTGALNRRAFEEHWSSIAELFSESHCHISLIIFDINNFKSINDTYGHPTGDVVLKKFSCALQKVLRKGEKIYRIGGDEFATTLYNCTPEDAIKIANHCQKAISNISFIKQGIKEPVRSSIGVAHNDTANPNSITNLLWQADIAVYAAKKPGQSHVVTYSDELKNISNTVLSSKINDIVFNAIEHGNNITMFYQPIINLNNGHPEYYEALLRIKNDNKIILPNKVFQLTEARKLDYELDTAIFKQIASDLNRGIIPLNSGVSINVSGPSIINPKIVDQLAIFIPFLEHYKIILEITETSLITNINHATENITQLKESGFLIALDDFGSGYSSISYLSSMPVDIVKFDITLIKQLEDEKQCSIISHLAKMIMETDHLLVAEGIETEEIKEKIKHLGFNYAQGYFYGKPSPTIK